MSFEQSPQFEKSSEIKSEMMKEIFETTEKEFDKKSLKGRG